MQSYSNIIEGGIPLRNLTILSKQHIGSKTLYSIRLTYHDGYVKVYTMVPEEILSNYMDDLFNYGNNADVYIGCKTKDVDYNLPVTQQRTRPKSMIQLH